MISHTPTKTSTVFRAVPIFAALLLFFTGCSQSDADTPKATAVFSELSDNDIIDSDDLEVSLGEEQLACFATVDECVFTEDEQLSLSLSMPALPKSDDSLIYLFAFEIYDDQHLFDKEPVACAEKSCDCTIDWDYQEGQLYQEFVPAILLKGKYIPIATGSFITNPEEIASNQEPFPETTSKKGLLLDPEMLGTPLLTDLGVQHAIYNIPLSMILGETTDKNFPTISYRFRDKTYYFNGAVIDSYDNLFSYLTNINMTSTAIVLNDWNDAYPEIIHPLSRNSRSGAYYYALNTSEEEGCLLIEAVASFLASRYNGGKHGLVSGWVIANEINQHNVWNYMDTTDITYYAAEFEKSMRIFYNAVKSNYANAQVYFSIDHDWNTNNGTKTKYFNAKDLVAEVNQAALSKGNYDWGLAIHPYPDPLTRVNYWTVDYDKSIDSPLLTLMNLSTVTDFLAQEEFLDRSGQMRNITVTELGFSSASGEKLQAAAFAYCYLIIDANPHINAFIMNRQTDAMEEVKQGLAFGIYEFDHTGKYILDVFKYIDTDRAGEYTDFMLNILGAESIDEALRWAK